MECPKCKKDYGEMITICPDCFIEIYEKKQPQYVSHKKKPRKSHEVSKSKGLLESALSSLFNSPAKTEEKISETTTRKRHRRGDTTKSSTGDYTSFSIDTLTTPTFSLDNPSIPEMSTSSYSTGSINIKSRNDFFTKNDLPASRDEHNIVSKVKNSSDPFVKTGGALSAHRARPPERKEVTSRSDRSTEHYELGRTYEKQKRQKEALFEYAQAIALKPDWAEPYYRSGLILAGNKDYGNAYKKLHKVITINPDNADAYYQLGKISMHRDFKEDAKRFFNLALEKKPGLKAAKDELEKIYKKIESKVKVRCISCGAFQPGRAKFCGNCGGKVK